MKRRNCSFRRRVMGLRSKFLVRQIHPCAGISFAVGQDDEKDVMAEIRSFDIARMNSTVLERI